MEKEAIWIVRGSQRRAVFSYLPEEPFMPNKLRKQINEKTSLNLSLREMSRHLRDFEDRKFVKCLNKNDPYNKIYRLTDKGKEIIRDSLMKNV